MSLFAQCVRPELEVLIKGLEKLDDSKLSKEQKEYRVMCLGTLHYELENRYTRWEKK